MAIGMALYGLRPVVEIEFADFIYPAFDQLVSEMATMRFRSGGQFTAPVVVRAPSGGGIKGGLYHSQSPEAHFIHTPGFTVVMPSTPSDARGLLTSAIRGHDPVLFLEPKALYRTAKEDIPEGEIIIPLRKGRVARPGDDVRLVAWGAMVPVAGKAADIAASEGVRVEVIDPRTLWPIDISLIEGSVRRTGRAVVLHEAPRSCGFGSEISALIQERCFLYLKAPVMRVTGYDTPFPYALEKSYMPDPEKAADAIRSVMNF
jgi:pyruvate dehydrogenase E1 component beta subunit